ncbi:MAG: molybdenum cofactor guanylyltransferase [Pseudomonadota bacterium]|jgi:molybdopterin-guanine dinucleotide biosynthesis protein A
MTHPIAAVVYDEALEADAVFAEAAALLRAQGASPDPWPSLAMPRRELAARLSASTEPLICLPLCAEAIAAWCLKADAEPSDHADLCAVLAGGEGRRIGGGKPLLRLDGQRLIDRSLDLARGFGRDVVIVARTPDQVEPVDAPVILDAPDIEGPLGGLAAALRAGLASDAQTVLTVPCDMPFLPGDLAQRLIAGLSGFANAVMAAHEEQLFPVCAVWRTDTVRQLDAYVASGRRSLRGFAEYCGATTVRWPSLYGGNFANVNSLEDLSSITPKLD